jgi:hypothetical protein
MNQVPKLRPSQTSQAVVTPLGEQAWRLVIPAGPSGHYRLAQLDDYGSLPRRKFYWQPPFHLKVKARTSHETIPGTWGFGLWNDPFGMAIMSGAEVLRLPALPNTIWFFFASQKNYLSLRDDIPASGPLAATFQSPRIPGLLLGLAVPLAPLLAFRPGVRWLRSLARKVVHQDAVSLAELKQTDWHTYEFEWRAQEAVFWLDGVQILQTYIVPKGPLGLVLWIDNQYAALAPSGRVGFGTEPNPETAWIELADLDYGKA